MFEVHETSAGQTAYYVGTPGDFANPVVLDVRGFRPRVAADAAAGTAVEVHQAQPGVGTMLSRVGRIAATDGRVSVAWSPALSYGSGIHPAIAAVTGQAIEVDMADADGSAVMVRTGHYDASAVVWNASRPLGTSGYNPAVAVDASEVGGNVLVVDSYNGRIRVHKSLLDVILHDKLPEQNAEKPPILQAPQGRSRTA